MTQTTNLGDGGMSQRVDVKTEGRGKSANISEAQPKAEVVGL